MDELLPFETWPDATQPPRRLLGGLSDEGFALVVELLANAAIAVEAIVAYADQARRPETGE